MLRVYDHYKYVYSYSAEIDLRRQNLTSVDVKLRLTSKVDPRAVRVYDSGIKYVHTLQKLMKFSFDILLHLHILQNWVIFIYCEVGIAIAIHSSQ